MGSNIAGHQLLFSAAIMTDRIVQISVTLWFLLSSSGKRASQQASAGFVHGL